MMSMTVTELQIATLTKRIDDLEAENERLKERLGKWEAAVGWIIAAGTGIAGFITALRAGVFKWLGSVGG